MFAPVGRMVASYDDNHVKQLTAATRDHLAPVLSAAFPSHCVKEAERKTASLGLLETRSWWQSRGCSPDLHPQACPGSAIP